MSVSTAIASSNQDSTRFVKVSNVESNGPVFRAISPFSVKLETRSRNLDEFLEIEQAARLRAERQIDDLLHQNQMYQQELEEANFAIAQHVDNVRKRDTEINSLRKSLQETKQIVENIETTLQKRYKTTVADLSSEIETLQKHKEKNEKDKGTLLNEIENAFLEVETATKLKAQAESKLEGYDLQIANLNRQIEELQRQLNDSTCCKVKLQTDLLSMEQELQELHIKFNSINRDRNAYQVELEELKKLHTSECHVRALTQSQLNSLQQDFDNLQVNYEEENETVCNLRAQNSKINADLLSIKSKYEKEILEKSVELEEIKRKLNIKIHEHEDELERERSKLSSMEKSKNKLIIELKEAHNEIENISREFADQTAKFKALEVQFEELELHLDNLEADIVRLNSNNSVLLADNSRLKIQVEEYQDKLAVFEKESRQLNEENRELKAAVRESLRRIGELESGKAQAELARENAIADLHDSEDNCHGLERKLATMSSSLNTLKQEMESRLHEKDDEMTALRKSTQNTIDELNSVIGELENKYKTDMLRTKKKFEITIQDLENENAALNHANVVLDEAKKELEVQINDLELQLTNQRNEYENLLANFHTSERRRIQVTDDLTETRHQLESSERARKSFESDLFDAQSKVADVNLQLSNSLNERRRLEGEIAILHSDLDDSLSSKEAAEDKINALKKDLLILAEELQLEQENHKHAEQLRKSLESEVREMTLKLEHLEGQTAKENRKAVQKLQARIRDLEIDNESLTQSSKESQGTARKLERQVKEITQQADEDRRLVLELQDLLEKTQIKMKTYKRQSEEAEELASNTLAKFRKTQRELEECEIRATMAERSLKHGTGAASNSVQHLRSQSITRRSNSLCPDTPRLINSLSGGDSSINNFLQSLKSSNSASARNFCKSLDSDVLDKTGVVTNSSPRSSPKLYSVAKFEE